jgi:hypothetical protein
VNPTTSTIVISQVYGAGGNPGSVYNADYVELHNNGTTPQTITNYSVQYYSATGNSTWSGRAKLPTATIVAGGYYLIQMSAAGVTNGIALPTPDYIASPAVSMSATNGRVALVSDTISLTGCNSTSSILDLVGYGTSVCFEGSAAVPALDTTRAAFRNNNGRDDTNNNSADFTLGAPLPRNSLSPVDVCLINNWTGQVNTSWENPANWSCGFVPDSTTEVNIGSGKANYPEVNSQATCKKITTAQGATIKVNTGYTLNVVGH